MIYTITLNPAVDYFLEINGDLIIDEVNRGTNAIFKAGGKGINVSKILSLLEIDSKAVVLLGGFTGEFIRNEVSRDPHIQVIAINVDDANRINMKAHYDHKALCINGDGPLAGEDTKKDLLASLEAVTKEDHVLISGSMMNGLDEDYLIKIADLVHEKGAGFAIDMEKISAETLFRCRPSLIKPNLYELQLLMNDKELDANNAEKALSELRCQGIGSILLSLGKDGALLADEEGFLYLEQPDTILVNKVGAGDAMLAAYLGMLIKTGDRKLALRYGGAAGNAVASQLEDIDLAKIEQFLPLMGTRE